MTFALTLTQAPQASYLNGGTSATSRTYWIRPTQKVSNGPRIATAVAGMVPGDFRSIWVNSSGYIFQVTSAEDGAGFNILDWNPRGAWDQSTEQIIIGGFRERRKWIAYSDVVGDWREILVPLPIARQGGTGHWYGMTVGDNAGYVYMGGAGAVSIYKLNPANDVSVETGNHEVTNGSNGAMLSWSPDLFTSGGVVKYAGDAKRWLRYNPDTNTWDRPAQGLGHGMHALLEYQPTCQRWLLVGGSSTSQRASLVTAAGAVTQVTDIPGPISMSEGSWIVAHPDGYWLVTTFGATRKLWAVWPNEALNDVIWQDLGTAPDSALTYPTAAYDANRNLVYIVATAGLYAYKPLNLVPPGAGGSIDVNLAPYLVDVSVVVHGNIAVTKQAYIVNIEGFAAGPQGNAVGSLASYTLAAAAAAATGKATATATLATGQFAPATATPNAGATVTVSLDSVQLVPATGSAFDGSSVVPLPSSRRFAVLGDNRIFNALP